MKKMTCREMGGACDAEIQGETAEEMMENGKQHVHSLGDDETHQAIVKEMENSTEEQKAAWMDDFKGKFAAAQDA